MPSLKLTPDLKSSIACLYRADTPIADIKRRLGVARTTIYRALRSMNRISRKRTKFTPYKFSSEIELKIANEYFCGASSGILARKYGVSDALVVSIARRRGIQIRNRREASRRHSLNEEAFDSVSEESADWAGFLMADGCIQQRGLQSATISLGASWKDRAHILKFRKFLGSSHAVTTIRPESNHGFQAVVISINSQYLAMALAKYGVTQDKTRRGIPDSRISSNRHFWRGLVDGDGTVGCYTGRPLLALSGNKNIIDSFSKFIEQNLSFTPPQFKYDRERIHHIRIAGRRTVAVVRLLYSTANISLARKYSAATDILSRFAHLPSPE